MLHSFEDKVRLRAYEIWLSAGMAHGKAHNHWISAEQALMKAPAKPKKARAKTISDADTATGAAKVAMPKPKTQTATRRPKAKPGRVTN